LKQLIVKVDSETRHDEQQDDDDEWEDLGRECVKPALSTISTISVGSLELKVLRQLVEYIYYPKLSLDDYAKENKAESLIALINMSQAFGVCDLEVSLFEQLSDGKLCAEYKLSLLAAMVKMDFAKHTYAKWIRKLVVLCLLKRSTIPDKDKFCRGTKSHDRDSAIDSLESTRWNSKTFKPTLWKPISPLASHITYTVEGRMSCASLHPSTLMLTPDTHEEDTSYHFLTFVIHDVGQCIWIGACKRDFPCDTWLGYTGANVDKKESEGWCWGGTTLLYHGGHVKEYENEYTKNAALPLLGFKPGDQVSLFHDRHQHTLSYGLNGAFLGVAFKDVPSDVILALTLSSPTSVSIYVNRYQ
jgi:hypothetical protein